MASTVRIFALSGLAQAPTASGNKLATDSVGIVQYPYLARESIVAGAAAQSTSAATAPDGTGLFLIQVQQGKAVHIEVNTPNRAVAADVNSPIITGDVIIKGTKNWTLSFLEHEIV